MGEATFWLNKDARPPGDEFAQAAWLDGQWVYIPWVRGTGPVRPWGGTQDAARATAKHVIRLIDNAKTETDKVTIREKYAIVAVHHNAESALARVYSLSVTQLGPYLIANDDGSIYEEIYVDYESVVDAAKDIATKSTEPLPAGI